MSPGELSNLADKAQALQRTNKPAAGAIFIQVKKFFAANPSAGLWSDWMRSRNFKWEQTKKCAYAFDSKLAAEIFPPSLARTKTLFRPGISSGEVHEATRGFKAMITKAAAEEDITNALRRRTVAFQHFKFLLTNSNLPELMSMTPDEIIELVRKL